MKNYRRREGRSLEQRVYHWLKKRETASAREIAAGIGVGYWAGVQAVMRLCRKGSVSKHGNTHTRVYKVTDIAPDDFRGTALESLSALVAKQQKPKPRIEVPTPATALEQAWGWGLLPFPRLPEE